MPDDPHEPFMREAIALAREAVRTDQGGPFGAVIVRDGLVVGRGLNRVTSTNDPTAHAEVVAIRDACRALGTFSLAGCEIYTSCEPCPMCLAAILWSRLDRVWYAGTRHDAAAAGFDDENFYRELAAAPADRSVPAELLLRDEALGVFRDWDAKPDKTPY